MNTQKRSKRVWPNQAVIKTLKELRSICEEQKEYHFKGFFHSGSTGQSSETHYAKEQAFGFVLNEINLRIEAEKNKAIYRQALKPNQTLVELASTGKL